MSDFIRGGQVSFHKIRMLMQVSKVIFRLSIALVIGSIGYGYYKNFTPHEWHIGFVWLKKDMIKSFQNENALITYKNRNNVPITVKIKDFEKDRYIVKTIDKYEYTLHQGFIRAAIILGVVIGGVLTFFTLKGKRIKLSHQIRGMFINKNLKVQITKHNKKIASYHPFTIADFAYPITGRKNSWTAGEQSHTIIVGATGAGKTKIIQKLVLQLQEKKQKAIIVDVKGDYIKYFYREGDIILNPLDKRGKNWTFFNETNALKGYGTISKSMLPKESKSDPIWTEAARAVFAELANLYANENLALNEFADKILTTDLKTLTKLLKKTAASKIINKEIEKAALSVLMVLATYLRPLRLYRSGQDCFSITDWVNDNSQNNFLFISSKADAKEDLNPLISTQVDIAVTALRSLTEESNVPKIWFILDELPYFNQSIPSLNDGLAMSRSYGGCFVLGTQDINQLSKIYSEETAKSIANNCKTKIIMNVEGKDAASWCAASLGDGEMEEWHEGLSYGAHEMRDGVNVNRNRIIRPIVLPSELMMLKAGEGYIKFGGFEPSKFNFASIELNKVAEGFENNTELLEIFKVELAIAQKRRQEIEGVHIPETDTQPDITQSANANKDNDTVIEPQATVTKGDNIIQPTLMKQRVLKKIKTPDKAQDHGSNHKEDVISYEEENLW